MDRVGQEEDKYVIGESLLSLFWNLKMEREGNLMKVKWSLIWLGSETGLEQVADGLKWQSGIGENGRSDDKDEF
jgi:hypothetical protein